MTRDKVLDSPLCMDYMGGIRSNILTGKERKPKESTMTENNTTANTATAAANDGTTPAATTAKKPRSDAPVPAHEILDDFDMPTSTPKYPWRKLTVGQVVAFPGVTSEESERLIRSATSTGRHYGLKFATKRLPKSEKFPDGALAIKLVSISEKPVAKKKAAKASTPAPAAAAEPTTGEQQQQKIA